MKSEEQEKLEKALAPFTEETGIEIVYEGTDSLRASCLHINMNDYI